MNLKHLITLRAAGAVKRCHTARIRAQNVAEHSWGVAMLLLTVWPDVPRPLLIYSMTHDLPELYTGDTPANAKWAAPNLERALREMETDFIHRFDLPAKSLYTDEELAVLKWCDGAELALYCLEELYQGNRYALEVLHRITGAMVQRKIPERCEGAMRYVMKLASTFQYARLPADMELYNRSENGSE